MTDPVESQPDPALDMAVTLIAEFEGFRSHPYQDVAGIWTIGYGFTYDQNVRRVTATTPPMTETDARAWLRTLVTKTLTAVRAMVYEPVTPAQLAALTSFSFNEGTAALRGSSLLGHLNVGEFAAAADSFMAWVYAGGKPIEGLRRRRMRERAVFLGVAV